jgi:hypothetical protein
MTFGFIMDVSVREYQNYLGKNMQEGYGFITFSTYESAFDACQRVRDVNIDGITLTCTLTHQHNPTSRKHAKYHAKLATSSDSYDQSYGSSSSLLRSDVGTYHMPMVSAMPYGGVHALTTASMPPLIASAAPSPSWMSSQPTGAHFPLPSSAYGYPPMAPMLQIPNPPMPTNYYHPHIAHQGLNYYPDHGSSSFVRSF